MKGLDKEKSKILLELLAKSETRREYLDSLAARLRQWSGCRNIGIRLIDSQGKVSYASYIGFSKKFRQLEGRISLDKDSCICQLVTKSKKIPASSKKTTKQGSFISNNLQAYKKQVTKTGLGLRLVCARYGFNTLAVIPIKAKGKVLGVVHMADRRKGGISLNKVHDIESMMPFIGEAIRKYDMMDQLTKDLREVHVAETQLKSANEKLLTLFSTSTMLQLTRDIEEIASILVGGFRSLGYDRVRVYLMKDKKLYGLKSSHSKDSDFQKKVIEITKTYPKAYEAIVKKKPVHLRDILSKYPDALKKYKIIESASLPLLCKNKVIGLISVDNKYSKRKISSDDLNFLMTFANHVAAVLENAVLYDEIQRKLKNQSILLDISRAASSTLDIGNILNYAANKLTELLKVDASAVYLFEKKSSMFLPVAASSKIGFFKAFEVGWAMKNEIYQNFDVFLLYSGSEYKHVYVTPIGVEGMSIGTLAFFTKEKRRFGIDEESLIKTIANQISIMIENAKLYSRIKEDKENLSLILEISQSLNSTLHETKLLQLILDKVVAYTGADSGMVMLVEGDVLRVKFSRDVPHGIVNKEYKIGEGIIGSVAMTGRPEFISNRQKLGEISRDAASIAAVPLVMKNNVIGVLYLESKKPANFERLAKSVRILTNQFAIAIENTRLYEKVRRFNEQLTQEIEKATRELREANEELKKMDRMKSEFVSNVSHELRTPLTSITGYSKLLFMEKLGRLNDKQKESLKIITSEGERLTRLINDVLDLSRLESGKAKPVFEMTRIDEIARECAAAMMPQANEKRIKLLVEAKKVPETKAAPDLMKQVFMNLLSNAVKFTEKGRIEVDVRKKGAWIISSIKDTGVGIPKDAIPKLFDKFYQVDMSMTRKHGGTGLGLVIVKHIIEEHNGKIEVKSKEGKGSTFIFYIPLRN
ncbi:MAG: GAF domain-containing protein [Candidatus Woesearchaeota archaeon]